MKYSSYLDALALRLVTTHWKEKFGQRFYMSLIQSLKLHQVEEIWRPLMKLKVNDVVSHLRSMADMEFKIMSTWSNSFLRVEKTEKCLYKNGYQKKVVKFSPKIHNLVEFRIYCETFKEYILHEADPRAQVEGEKSVSSAFPLPSFSQETNLGGRQGDSASEGWGYAGYGRPKWAFVLLSYYCCDKIAHTYISLKQHKLILQL